MKKTPPWYGLSWGPIIVAWTDDDHNHTHKEKTKKKKRREDKRREQRFSSLLVVCRYKNADKEKRGKTKQNKAHSTLPLSLSLFLSLYIYIYHAGPSIGWSAVSFLHVLRLFLLVWRLCQVAGRSFLRFVALVFAPSTLLTCQWNKSSPAGPALQDVGGSFCRS